jgi:F-type H+-transporting ATPase subunit epsilon
MEPTATFRLRVVTPDRVVVDETVRAVTFMGVDGSYGILANHAALVTATEPGILAFTKENGEREELVITDGFAEMRDNVLSVVSEAGEPVREIDVERARAAAERAQEILDLREQYTPEEIANAEAALRRAKIRQLAAQKH